MALPTTSGHSVSISKRESVAYAIDTDQLFARCMGNVSFALTLLGELETSGNEHVENISRHLANRDCDEAAEAAHALKGAAGILCAEAIRSLAAEIETEGKIDNLARVTSLVAELRQEMEKCLKDIPKIRQQHAVN